MFGLASVPVNSSRLSSRGKLRVHGEPCLPTPRCSSIPVVLHQLLLLSCEGQARLVWKYLPCPGSRCAQSEIVQSALGRAPLLTSKNKRRKADSPREWNLSRCTSGCKALRSLREICSRSCWHSPDPCT